MKAVSMEPVGEPVSDFSHRGGLRSRIGFGVAVLILALIVVLSLLASIVAPFDPIAQNLGNAMAAPGSKHWLGTDSLGRDVLSRLIWGIRPALGGMLISIATAIVLGVPWGLVAGYASGMVDMVLMRVVDALLVFPGLVLVLVLTAVLGANLENSMLALGIIYAPVLARVVRSGVITVRNREFVTVTRLYGLSPWYRMWRHVMPNALGPAVVQTTLLAGTSLLAQVGLGFLGIGVQPPLASWGGSLAEAFQYIVVRPSATFAPGLLVAIVVVCIYRVGDEIRDRVMRDS
jgi:peptide/nickel transport system permease protein